MLKKLYTKFIGWHRSKKHKKFHKKLLKQYIKTLKSTNDYKTLYGRFSITFQESKEFNFAPLLEAIARKAEEDNTTVKI